MPKISGLGLGEIKKISGLGIGEIKKISGLGLGTLWESVTHLPISFVGRGTGSSQTAATSVSVTLPSSGAVNGELYLVFFSPGVNATCTTTSTGWTKLTQVFNGTTVAMAVFAGAVGTAGALTVSLSASQTHSYCVVRIAGWNGNISDIQISSTQAGTANPNACPSLTSSFGTLQHGWVEAYANVNGDLNYSASAASSGFSNFQKVSSLQNANSAYCATATAELVANGPTQTPGNWGNAVFSGAAYVSLLVGVPQ